jgi:hypothetical protein
MENENFEKEYKLIVGNDTVKIKLSVSKFSGSYLPDINGKEEITVKFKTMSVVDYWTLSSLSKMEIVQNERTIAEEVDYEEFNRQIIRYQLIDCSFIKLEFDELDRLTEESWNKVLSQPAPLISALLDEYAKTYIITREEDESITKQAAILFSKNSRGVENACEAITLFCVLGTFWEKFGLKKDDLKKLSYKEYLMLRMVIAQEITTQRASMNSGSKKSNTMIAGKGGKIRPSNGIVQEG